MLISRPIGVNGVKPIHILNTIVIHYLRCVWEERGRGRAYDTKEGGQSLKNIYLFIYQQENGKNVYKTRDQ